MDWQLFLLFCSFTLIICCESKETANEEKKCELKSKTGSTRFPDYFKFGVATAAYQIEGGWNDDGKGPSIWDTFTHEHPEMIDDRSNGDIAADSYHRFDQDLAALKELKVNYYRLSISWSRILPTGDVSSLNAKGIAYYDVVINKLIANGIEPMVTMFHYDMPEQLNSYGGFTNIIFVDYFYYYAKTLYTHFGDRVKNWITFNEPFDYCVPGYGNGNYPPMVQFPGVADYLCMDTTLKAHTVAYRLYKSEFYEQQRGKVGITLSSRFYYSMDNNQELIDRAMQYSLGWLATPLFGQTGNYPSVMLEDILANSVQEGRAWSRLRSLSDDWQKTIKDAADFLGLNYYTTRYIELATPPISERPSYDYDLGLRFKLDPTWKRAKSSWLYCVPEGLEGLLNWIRVNYNNIEVFVTENGWSDSGELKDIGRIDYLKAHLQAVLNAVNNGCNVTRYTHWSLIDNFEWQKGYTEKFGLYFVNMTSEQKERIPKQSAGYYKKVIETKLIPESV